MRETVDLIFKILVLKLRPFQLFVRRDVLRFTLTYLRRRPRV
jgi:hypothetical protein